MGWVNPWVGSIFFSFWWVGSAIAKVGLLKFERIMLLHLKYD